MILLPVVPAERGADRGDSEAPGGLERSSLAFSPELGSQPRIQQLQLQQVSRDERHGARATQRCAESH